MCLQASYGAYLRLLASADFAAGTAAAALRGGAAPAARSNLKTLAVASASLSTTGCAGAGKKLAKRNSWLLSPLSGTKKITDSKVS